MINAGNGGCHDSDAECIRGCRAFTYLGAKFIYQGQPSGDPVHKPGKRLYLNKQELLDWIMGGRRKMVSEIQWEAEQHLVDLGHKRKARRF